MPCTYQDLATDSTCYRCLDSRTLLAIILYATAKEATALGYTSVNSTSAGLLQATQCFAECSDPQVIMAAFAQIAVTKANAAGAALSTDVGSLSNTVDFLKHIGTEPLMGALASILCTMGPHEAA